MTTYLGKSCSFGLPRVPFVNCRQFMYLVISLLVLRAGCGIWLYQFLIIAYPFTFLRPNYSMLQRGCYLTIVCCELILSYTLYLKFLIYSFTLSSRRHIHIALLLIEHDVSMWLILQSHRVFCNILRPRWLSNAWQNICLMTFPILYHWLLIYENKWCKWIGNLYTYGIILIRNTCCLQKGNVINFRGCLWHTVVLPEEDRNTHAE